MAQYTDILSRYGIKEVADVTFYKLTESGKRGAPVLYLDTLKVSTIEQTAENTSARGGKGNPELIVWDYGKEITVTLEDALFSAKSLAIMYGAVDNDGDPIINSVDTIYKTVPRARVEVDSDTGAMKTTINGTEFNIVGGKFYDAEGKRLTSSATTPAATDIANMAKRTDWVYITFPISIVGKEFVISADTFPGTYYITGDTYARSETTGIDEFFQFIIPKAKVLSEVTLTMEADGDPTTFSMDLKVLRPADGKMMKLVQYRINKEPALVNDNHAQSEYHATNNDA